MCYYLRAVEYGEICAEFVDDIGNSTKDYIERGNKVSFSSKFLMSEDKTKIIGREHKITINYKVPIDTYLSDKGSNDVNSSFAENI